MFFPLNPLKNLVSLNRASKLKLLSHNLNYTEKNYSQTSSALGPSSNCRKGGSAGCKEISDSFSSSTHRGSSSKSSNSSSSSSSSDGSSEFDKAPTCPSNRSWRPPKCCHSADPSTNTQPSCCQQPYSLSSSNQSKAPSNMQEATKSVSHPKLFNTGRATTWTPGGYYSKSCRLTCSETSSKPGCSRCDPCANVSNANPPNNFKDLPHFQACQSPPDPCSGGGPVQCLSTTCPSCPTPTNPNMLTQMGCQSMMQPPCPCDASPVCCSDDFAIVDPTKKLLNLING
ncbi:hypothetical protein TKK_0012410 [Trichogramma kaykai]